MSTTKRSRTKTTAKEKTATRAKAPTKTKARAKPEPDVEDVDEDEVVETKPRRSSAATSKKAAKPPPEPIQEQGSREKKAPARRLLWRTAHAEKAPAEKAPAEKKSRSKKAPVAPEPPPHRSRSNPGLAGSTEARNCLEGRRAARHRQQTLGIKTSAPAKPRRSTTSSRTRICSRSCRGQRKSLLYQLRRSSCRGHRRSEAR